MLDAVNHFFSAFGATVVVPIMIFVIALFLKVRPKVAMMNAFYAGVGLTGFSWIISEFTPIVTDIIKRMVDNTGIKLPVVDIGWQAGSLTTFSSSVGLTFFVSGLVFEVIIFALGITKIFMPTNLWNNFGFMLWGTLAYFVTRNFWLSLGLSFFMLLYALLLAEVQADRWSDYYGVKNATVASLHNIEQVIPALLLDPLWNILGFDKVKLTPETFKTRLGVFGEPTTLGALLGLIIGVIGHLNELNTLEAWGRILQFSIQLAAVMTIFPLVTEVFAKAFTPLANEIDKNRTQEAVEGEEIDLIKDKKRWFLGIDDGVGYGEPATIIASVILIPIVVVIAFTLPGNQTLPIVDLISLPFMIESIVALTRGNILKVIANSIVWFTLGLYASSWLGTIYTGAASYYGAAIPTGVILITSFNLVARPLNALVFAAFISQDPFWIGLCLLVYLILVVLFRRYRNNIWTYLAKMSAKNAEFNGSDDKIEY